MKQLTTIYSPYLWRQSVNDSIAWYEGCAIGRFRHRVSQTKIALKHLEEQMRELKLMLQRSARKMDKKVCFETASFIYSVVPSESYKEKSNRSMWMKELKAHREIHSELLNSLKTIKFGEM